jgi:3-hydroxymyristoyl/3-hydroxydecanoyl-(acyl carrier protein) dehydratase
VTTPIPLGTHSSRDGLERQLSTHEWVSDARLLTPNQRQDAVRATAALVVPSGLGLQALCRLGRSRVIQALQAATDLAAEGDSPALIWRFLEELPASGSAGEKSCLGPISMPHFEAIEIDGAGVLRSTVRVPYDLAVFEGHFPAAPIVPGVLQIGWSIKLAREHLGVTGRLRSIPVAKFRRIVGPGALLELELSSEPGSEVLEFRYSSHGKAVSSGRVLLERSHD